MPILHVIVIAVAIHITQAAAAQQPAHPEPIGVEELAVLEQILELSPAQRHGLTFLYEAYRERATQLPDHIKEPPRPAPTLRGWVNYWRDVESRYRLECQWLEERELDFLAQTAAILSEQQHARMPHILQMREAARMAYARRYMRISMKPLIELDRIVYESDGPEVRISSEMWVAYRDHLNRRLRELESVASAKRARLTQKLADEHGVMLIAEAGAAGRATWLEVMSPGLEMANAIDDYNRAWAFETASQLPAIEATELLHLYGEARRDLTSQLFFMLLTVQEMLRTEDSELAEFRAAIERELFATWIPQLRDLVSEHDQIVDRWFGTLMPRPNWSDPRIQGSIREFIESFHSRVMSMCEGAPGGVAPEQLVEYYNASSIATGTRERDPRRSVASMTAENAQLRLSVRELHTICSRMRAWESHEAVLRTLIADYDRVVTSVFRDVRGGELDLEAVHSANEGVLSDLRAILDDPDAPEGDLSVLDMAQQCLERASLYRESQLRGVAAVDPVRHLVMGSTMSTPDVHRCTEPLLAFHEAAVPLLRKRTSVLQELAARRAAEDEGDPADVAEIHVIKDTLASDLAIAVCRLMDAVVAAMPSLEAAVDEFFQLALPHVFAPRDAMRARYNATLRLVQPHTQEHQALDDVWIKYLEADAGILDALVSIACRATTWTRFSEEGWIPAVTQSEAEDIYEPGRALLQRQRELHETTTRQIDVLSSNSK